MFRCNVQGMVFSPNKPAETTDNLCIESSYVKTPALDIYRCMAAAMRSKKVA